MDTLEIVYYTCLNNECPKHRSVFMEGDPQHEGCERERLWLEGQEPVSQGLRWMWIALPALLATAAAGVYFAMRMRGSRGSKPRTLHDEIPMKTWSGAQSHRDDREGNAVPPPIT
jgi:hypothetical protein